ncbi:MAG TPA: CARDB domain-containing protein [Gaiellaceae bacterium]|jgi:hypothetical protein
MSTFDDDDIEFDFFDEPETQEAPQRRRLPRLDRGRGGDRPPRAPLRPSTGLTPLLRLLGLIALMIFVVVVLVFWVQSCEGSGKHSSYQHYMDKVRPLANGSARIGRDFAAKLTTPGIKESQLRADVSGLAQQAQQQAAQAQTIRPPGPLRLEQAHMIEALELRAKGLSRFADALGLTAKSKDASQAGSLLAQQARLLTASDVNWEFFFRDPSIQELKRQGITGVTVPQSVFLPNPELVDTSSMVQLFQSFSGASTGGTPTGVHGNGIVSVKAQPQGTQLSTSEPTVVKASTELAFQVTVENSGCCREVQVPVTLTIKATPKSIVKRMVIPVIGSGEQKTVTFTDIGQPPFGSQTSIKVVVSAVPGEKNLSNNSAIYPVFFSTG